MKKITLVLIFVALVALLGVTACAPFWGPTPSGGGMMGGQTGGGGMMGGQGGGGMTGGQGGGGMTGGQGGGGMMGGQGGGGMMGGQTGYYSEVPTALSHDDARAIADSYLAALNNAELEIDELEEYSHNFYVSLVEKSTGRGATEIIIDRYSGSYQPEPQSIMWNGKYGMMGSYQQAQMPVNPQQAMKIAQDFLDAVYPGTEADELVAYYGYYTIMTTLEDEHYGMLSVNGYSGDIWYHTWHGMFISELEEH